MVSQAAGPPIARSYKACREKQETRTLTDTFDALYAEHASSVYGYARARVGPDEAEDLTAEVFVTALRTILDGDEAKVTPAWLMTVTKNRVIDRWRHQNHVEDHRRHLRSETLSRRVDAWPIDTSDDAVVDALDYLSPLHRAVLLMKYVDGYSVNEIAEVVGKSHAATESTLARAKRAFRSSYEVQADG